MGLKSMLKRKDWNSIQCLLREGKTSEEREILSTVIKQQETEVIQFLYKNECRNRRLIMDEEIILSSTVLYIAFIQNHYQTVNFLLDYACEDYKYLVNKFGLSTLHIACAMGHVKSLEKLMNNKKSMIDINSAVSIKAKKWAGFTALHFAVEFGRSEIFEWLFEHGSDIHASNAEGSRPIHLAFEKEQSEYLLDVIVKSYEISTMNNYVNHYGLSYLHVASAHKNIDVMKALLEQTDASSFVNAQVFEDHTTMAGCSALHFISHKSCQEHSDEAIKLLVNHGADMTLKNSHGLTPIHTAYYNQESDNLTWIMLSYYNNFEDNPTDDNNLSVFHIACVNSAPSILKKFIQAGSIHVDACVIKSSKWLAGYTALHIAIYYRRASILELLLEAGANPNITEKSGMTGLHLACRISQFKIRQLKNFINTDNVNASTFNHCLKGLVEAEIVSLLIKHNADIDAKDMLTGKTPLLHLYDEQCDRSLIECFCKNYLLGNDDVLYLAIDEVNRLYLNKVLNDRYQIAKVLLDSGADPRICDSKGFNFLHTLAGSFPFISGIHFLTKKILLKFVNVDVETDDGETPLAIVTRSTCNDGLIELLLNNGANPNVIAGRNKCTPFHNYAKYSSTGTLLKKFVECGGNVDMRLKNGDNVLHVIFCKTLCNGMRKSSKTYNRNLSIFLKFLISLKCNINGRNRNGHTPLYYACKKNNIISDSVIDLLLENGAVL